MEIVKIIKSVKTLKPKMTTTDKKAIKEFRNIRKNRHNKWLTID